MKSSRLKTGRLKSRGNGQEPNSKMLIFIRFPAPAETKAGRRARSVPLKFKSGHERFSGGALRTDVAPALILSKKKWAAFPGLGVCAHATPGGWSLPSPSRETPRYVLMLENIFNLINFKKEWKSFCLQKKPAPAHAIIGTDAFPERSAKNTVILCSFCNRNNPFCDVTSSRRKITIQGLRKNDARPLLNSFLLWVWDISEKGWPETNRP